MKKHHHPKSHMLLALVLMLSLVLGSVPAWAESPADTPTATEMNEAAPMEEVEDEVTTETAEDAATNAEAEATNPADELELGDELISPPVTQTSGKREQIHITNSDEMIAFLNRKTTLSEFNMPSMGFDNDRYGIKDADIYLETDVELSSDDVNAQFSGNSDYPNDYRDSFYMLNCNFFGNGHTVTINKGTRDMYSLFGTIWANSDSEVDGTAIKDLTIVYNGDVHGSSFAQYIGVQNQGPQNIVLNNITTNVNGNILPLLRDTYYTDFDGVDEDWTKKYTNALAAGFSFDFFGASIDKVKIDVSGNIGLSTLQDPKTPEAPQPSKYADTDLVITSSSGFIICKKRQQASITLADREINNLSINVDGSILAKSSHYRATATGIGYDLQNKKFKKLNLIVGGDIIAETEGDYSLGDPYNFAEKPIFASAIGHSLRYIDNSADSSNVVKVGSIIAVNKSNMGFPVFAAGIGEECYTTDIPLDKPEEFPLIIKGVNLTIDGDVKAESEAEAYYQNAARNTLAYAGFRNARGGGLKHFDTFDNNTIQVTGDVQADTKQGTSAAWLWGVFDGNNNTFSAKSLKATNGDGDSLVAPFYHYFKGTGNNITVPEGITTDSTNDVAAGFANSVTTYNGAENNFTVGPITVTNPEIVGGFAGEVTTHKNHDKPDITTGVGAYLAPKVENVHITPTLVVNSKADKPSQVIDTYLGGFAGKNYNATIEKSSTTLTQPLSMTLTNITKTKGGKTYTGNAYIGGFVGYNKGDIDSAAANIKSLAVLGKADNQDNNNFKVGGFVGYGYGGVVNNATAFIEDGITTENGNAVHLGGFTGHAYDQKYLNDAVQVGENLTASKNAYTTNIGGFAGKLEVYRGDVTVDQSTALIFGDIKGDSARDDYPSLAAGFVGFLSGEDGYTTEITNAASYVGGTITMDSQVGGSAAAVGWLSKANLKGYTALAAGTLDNYIGAKSDDSVFSNNYLVEVNDANRTAFPVSLNADGTFAKGAEQGQIAIAGRALQDQYWGKDADSAQGTYADFDYVTENEKNIGFTPIATGSAEISADPFSKATLPNFYNRHLALLATNGPIYDILGIPAGEATAQLTVTFVSEDDTYAEVKVEKDQSINGDGLTDESMPADPTRKGYTFKGWNTAKDGKGETFTGDTLVAENLTVYAQWKKKSGGGSSGGSSTITPPILNTDDHYQYMAGYVDQTFRPDRNITREEVTAMFSRLLKDRPEKGKVYAYNFSDVNCDRWSITPVSYMSSINMVKGYPDGTFRPANNITRAEFAAMATRFAELTEGDAHFSDLSSNHWAYDAVARAATAGWISGYPDGSFKPNQPITRAEVIAITNRMLNRYADEAYVQKHGDDILYFSDNRKAHWAYYPIIEATNGHDYTRDKNQKEETWKEVNGKSFI